jgi:hypothetical protein
MRNDEPPRIRRSQVVQISTTPQVLRALQQLVRTGLFGKSVAEVAEELMRGRLRELVREGWTRRP